MPDEDSHPPEKLHPPGLSTGALALALIPPLAPIGLVLGIIAIARRSRHTGQAIASVAIAPLNAMCCLGIFVLLPSIGKSAQVKKQLRSAAQMRLIGQGLMLYAYDYNQWYPEAGADWEQRLIDAKLADPFMFVAPDADPATPSYYYIPGHRASLTGVPLLYEDPALWDGRGGHVYYDDGRLEWIERDDYSRLFQELEAQRQQALTHAGDQPADRSAAPTTTPPRPTTRPLPALPDQVVNIISRGMEFAEAPMHPAGAARLARARPPIPIGPTEAVIEWSMILTNQTDQEIDALILAIEGAALRQTINAIPAHATLMPHALLEVILPIKLPPGRAPASVHLRAEILAVRFASGETLGDPALLAGLPPAMGATRRGASSASGSGVSPQFAPFAEAFFVRRADITLTEAIYTTGETKVDVRPAIEAWMAEDDWPTPLRIGPSQLGATDFAPGEVKTLKLRFEVDQTLFTVEAADRDWLLIGGPASLGLGPVVGEPLEIGDMRIHAAWYGHMDRHVNVLPALRARIDDAGRIDTRASNGLAGMDPAVDVRKNLILFFERDGAFWQASYIENDTVRLPLPR